MSSNPPCPVCEAEVTRRFACLDARDYWRCALCEATFLDPAQLPERALEHAQYRLHRNEANDPQYRLFLSRLAEPLLERLPAGLSGLDYGCGPGPALAAMLGEAGQAMTVYDPLFFPDPSALARRYDFITCTEVVEHFHRPAREFARLDGLLEPGGWLAVLTTFQTEDAAFAGWHYRRDPTHVVFYRPQTFRRLARRHGWSCEIPCPNVALMRKAERVILAREANMQITQERVKVFWQPGCTSCLRTKEFLTRAGVDYESINVHGNEAAMAELAKLGARSVPIVARGETFVFAQTIGDVIGFLGLKIQPQAPLTPEALMAKLDLVLTAAARYVRQIPPAELARPFRNRNRPVRALAFHVFRIVEGFLESMQDGRELTYERIMRDNAPTAMTPEDLARYGEDVLARAKAWWAAHPDKTCAAPVPTYFGEHPLHLVLERTVWHPAQHTRQLMLVLESLRIAPDRPLAAADLAGLPLPEKAWDED